ncbi:penicillin-binding protein 2 [Piscinibacter koreensis]|uniref:Peptidoglycan D,D-transpeptidase MrdA n=1 Tax=Piscinibacter koreensis TaxID=2742824 RepID=A0A7Y6TUV4_9BURK|nr:penicillin-binding protein 2 [Schlegelella koreensis]NUZ04444.1 penicillin-binding protein 2 [Schlegelella koreensis]
MTEIRNTEHEMARFRTRLVAAACFVLFGFGLLGARLAWLQIARHDELATQAENNRIGVVPVVPNRGLILDRNGVVLANNYSAYTLEIAPARVSDLEGTIDKLSEIVEISTRDRRRFKRLMEESRSFESLPIRNRLTDEEVARFTAQRYRFEGVDVKARLFRSYPLGEVGSHLIGYIGRINEAEKTKLEESEDASNYRGTEYIGKLGVEQSYEDDLHGTTGFEEVEMSASGRPVRHLRSRPATPGHAVVMSIDIRLQAMVEALFGDRRGALVAIDPRNGEVLAFVSKPNFDPNLFVDGIDAESWKALNESPDKPLLNRALRGAYPPGSTYKPFMALAALTLGKRTPQQAISDPGYFNFGNHRFRDDKEGGHGTVDMFKSIVQSCDTYYYLLANDMGVDAMHDFMKPLGFGQITGIDMNGELRGTLPSTEWKRTHYRRNKAQQKWFAGETISLGIGQGYNAFTMLQLANATAILAAGGQRYKPHLVRRVENYDDRETRHRTADRLDALEPLRWKPEHVALIHRAMYAVTQEGTAARAFARAGYQSGGKTGTAQVIGIKQGEKYNASRIDERHRDHALYSAFAPLDNPHIAIAVIVENAGFGAGAAAPIARRVFDYVLEGKYPSEADIAATQKGQSTAPIGTPRSIDEVPLPGLTVDGLGAAAASATPPAGSLGAALAPAADGATPAPAAPARGRSPAAPRPDAPVAVNAGVRPVGTRPTPRRAPGAGLVR